jgi:hypothetical protein
MFMAGGRASNPKDTKSAGSRKPELADSQDLPRPGACAGGWKMPIP